MPLLRTHFVSVDASEPLLARSFDVPHLWNSQCGQDAFVHAALAWPADADSPPAEGRYFVDLAANRAVHLSNTRSLERDFGWRGLCIEGNPTLVRELLHHRECDVVEAVVAGHAREVAFLVNVDRGFDGLSRVAAPGEHLHSTQSGSGFKATVMQGLSLGSILAKARAPRVIDYLSLDVEGHEEEARARCGKPLYARPRCSSCVTLDRIPSGLAPAGDAHLQLFDADLPSDHGRKHHAAAVAHSHRSRLRARDDQLLVRRRALAACVDPWWGLRGDRQSQGGAQRVGRVALLPGPRGSDCEDLPERHRAGPLHDARHCPALHEEQEVVRLHPRKAHAGGLQVERGQSRKARGRGAAK
eukprot:4102950-Prymnesium_polylepis.2